MNPVYPYNPETAGPSAEQMRNWEAALQRIGQRRIAVQVAGEAPQPQPRESYPAPAPPGPIAHQYQEQVASPRRGWSSPTTPWRGVLIGVASGVGVLVLGGAALGAWAFREYRAAEIEAERAAHAITKKDLRDLRTAVVELQELIPEDFEPAPKPVIPSAPAVVASPPPIINP